MGDPDRAVRTVAATLGLELTESQYEQFATDIERTRDRLAEVECAGTPWQQAPRVLRDSEDPTRAAAPAHDGPVLKGLDETLSIPTESGTDPYNALRVRYPRAPTRTGSADGLEVALKDNVAVAGVELSCGSSIMECTPPSDAAVVASLLASGGQTVGTTTMDAYALHPSGLSAASGPVQNPVVPDRIPGGSSAGAAVAVAADIVGGAIGTDTGGSVRIPAACCGVVGMKPTAGLVSRAGVADLAPSLDAVGPIARDVSTLTRLLRGMVTEPATLELITTADGSDRCCPRTGDDTELRLGVLETEMDRASPAVARTVTGVLDRLVDAGVSVETMVGQGLSVATDAHLATLGPEFLASLLTGTPADGVTEAADWRYDRPEVLDRDRSRLDRRLAVTVRAAIRAEDPPRHVLETLVVGAGANLASRGCRYAGAQQERAVLARRLDARLSTVDALLAPTIPILPPRTDDDWAVRELVSATVPFNMTGHPAVSVHCGTVDGVPVGVQVIAARHDDGTALQVAAAIETVLGA